MDKMEQDYRRDQADMRAAADFANAIQVFLDRCAVPESRLSHHWINVIHRSELADMKQALHELSAHIVRVWD